MSQDVLNAIIKSFMGCVDLMHMDVIELLQHFEKLLLGGDPYLAEIDDIWDVKKAFPDKKNGSKIIIITAERVDDRCSCMTCVF